MKDMILALLSDSGQVSMMRVMSLLCCLTAIALSLIVVIKGHPIDYIGLTTLVSAFLAAAFTGKIMQKRIEASAKRK